MGTKYGSKFCHFDTRRMVSEPWKNKFKSSVFINVVHYLLSLVMPLGYISKI